ncbi:MAG: ABC transporter permease [Ruminococcaceae bacterium]|nr:ABC transporter permease [Oscillospiraceae bacterium]MBD5116011.1 ABC transporter permease [Oscillospiraceae bacterium]
MTVKEYAARKVEQIKQNRFLFEELVKRDFNKKYKRTILGMLWSILGPLMTLTVMALVFTQFFGRNINHYIIYLFCGNLLYGYFKESTNSGMCSLYNNSKIFSKVNVPKYMFLLSSNVSSLINFGINLMVLFLFCIIDGVEITWKFILLIYPVCCLVLFNVGMGLILSALYMMFRDMKYLYDIFTLLLMYLSAIFYSIDAYELHKQYLFYLNPIYLYIRYFRKIILEGVIPKPSFHLLAAGYVIVALVIGSIIYKKKNYKFLYYI